MKQCRCGTTYPDFMTACLTCGKDLGPSPITSAAQSIAKLRQARAVHGAGSLWGHMTRQLTADPDAVAARCREEVRRGCQLFHAQYAPRMAGQFSSAQLAEYLQQHTGDGVPLESVELRGRELIGLLHALAGLTREYEERIAKEREEAERLQREARQREAERLRAQQEAQEALRLRRQAEDRERRAGLVPSAEELCRRMSAMRAMGMTDEEIAAQLTTDLRAQGAVPQEGVAPATTDDLYG